MLPANVVRVLTGLCASLYHYWPEHESRNTLEACFSCTIGAIETMQMYLEKETPRRQARKDEDVLAHPALDGTVDQIRKYVLLAIGSRKRKVVYLDWDTQYIPSGDAEVVSLEAWLENHHAPIETDDFKRVCLDVLQGLGHMHAQKSGFGITSLLEVT